MTNPDEAKESIRIATEFLSLWLKDDREKAVRHIARVVHGADDHGRDRIITGLLNLNMLVILQLAQAHGTEDDEDMTAWAHEHLRRIAGELPDWDPEPEE
ncbi:hypothetical protein O7599_16870 [Streptomyces sp. WMMC500]|uniref:hypothetical protein n=1 Tax=Streptomyces sp. WMMC500 TaxID=3015154 RepID=UPI00248CB99F|nr:hypothetical protein [Streptomyces sp. WMMC500]WBB64082.1 hypothetical protein O7599_16870 [Streptomyces sp. WMMC500]